MNVYSRLLEEVRPHWKVATAGLFFSITMAVFELLPSVLTQWLIDDALGKKNLNLLYILAGALLALLLARTASHTARMIYLGKLAQLVLYQLRTRLYEDR